MLLLHITMTICPSGISGYCLKSCSTEHHGGGGEQIPIVLLRKHNERQIQKPLMQ